MATKEQVTAGDELPDNEINFELVDEERGLRFLFTTYEEHPGQIFTSTYVSEDEAEDGDAYYREPTDEEFTIIDLHPFSYRLRVDLIIESGKQWDAWTPYAQNMLNHALGKVQADEGIEA